MKYFFLCKEFKFSTIIKYKSHKPKKTYVFIKIISETRKINLKEHDFFAATNIAPQIAKFKIIFRELDRFKGQESEFQNFQKMSVGLSVDSLCCLIDGVVFCFKLVWEAVGSHFHSVKLANLYFIARHPSNRIANFILDEHSNLIVSFQNFESKIGFLIFDSRF